MTRDEEEGKNLKPNITLTRVWSERIGEEVILVYSAQKNKLNLATGRLHGNPYRLSP